MDGSPSSIRGSDPASGATDQPDTPTDEVELGIDRRRLADGREFRVIKVRRDPARLGRALAAAGFSAVDVGCHATVLRARGRDRLARSAEQRDRLIGGISRGRWAPKTLRLVDDQHVGAALRLVRHRRGWRQVDLAEAIGVHRSSVSRVERGHLEDHTLDAIRRMAAALDVRLDLVPRWRGGDLDRLLNARHSRLHEELARTFAGLSGWVAAPEVSFSTYGERGIVDVLAWHAVRRAVLVVEIKTDIVDVNELMGTLDRKRRLARGIAQARGWDASIVGCWVVVAESSTNRRRVEAHRTVLRSAFPMDGRAIPGWLRDPSVPMAGLSFWSGAQATHVRGGSAPIRRVRGGAQVPPERAPGSGRRSIQAPGGPVEPPTCGPCAPGGPQPDHEAQRADHARPAARSPTTRLNERTMRARRPAARPRDGGPHGPGSAGPNGSRRQGRHVYSWSCPPCRSGRSRRSDPA